MLLDVMMHVLCTINEDLNFFYHFPKGGSLVTTAWRVLRLRMEGTASRYGG
jgi:hypothetical protein